MEDPELTERRRLAGNCFACGSRNPIGLHMRFRIEGDAAVCEFEPKPEHQGYPGYVHGGIVSTMLDEAMGWATYGRDIWSVTARMSVRYREPVPLAGKLIVKGWIERDRGQFLELRSDIRTQDGKLLAEAEGLFSRLQGENAERISRAFYDGAEPRENPEP